MGDHMVDASKPRGRVDIQAGAGAVAGGATRSRDRPWRSRMRRARSCRRWHALYGISPQHLFVWRKAACRSAEPADEAPLFVPVVTELRSAGPGTEAGSTKLDDDHHRDWWCGGSVVANYAWSAALSAGPDAACAG